MISGAEFSPCGLYRYTLTRIWNEYKPLANWCALNPSTADEKKDDPTIIREMRFSKAWGFGGIIKTNIFAYRATDPGILRMLRDPIGPENDEYIKAVSRKCDIVIAAWGNHGQIKGRGSWVFHKLLAGLKVSCLGVNANGQPKHPLYLKSSSTLQRFEWPLF